MKIAQTTLGYFEHLFWRRGRESNPSRRLCRPLHNRFATSPEYMVRLLSWRVISQINTRRQPSLNSGAGEESRTLDLNLGKVALYQLSYSRLGVLLTTLASWSGRRVSNSRPQPWQGCALPTELLPHGVLHHQLTTDAPEWSGRRVSNSRPQPWQGCALPTELLPHSGDTHYRRNRFNFQDNLLLPFIAFYCFDTNANSGAGEESRTLDLNLGKVALYQLSYSRFVFRLLRCHSQQASIIDYLNRTSRMTKK